MQDSKPEEPLTVLSPNRVSDRITDNCGADDQRAQDHHIDATLAGDHTRHDHGGFARKNETNEEGRLPKNEENDEYVYQRRGKAVELLEDE